MHTNLVSSFLPQAGPLAAAFASGPELEALLRTLVTRGRRAWPALDVDDRAFIQHVARRLSDRRNASAEMANLHADDLYLAFACAAGDETAVAMFERHYVPEIAQVLSGMHRPVDFVQEVEQVLRHRLLLGDPGRAAKIADYSGRGPLASWVRAAAIRTALSMLRRENRHVPDDEQIVSMAAEGNDPELEFIRAQYRVEFRAALAEALAALDRRQRNVLRLHLLDGLSIDQIGHVHQTHRSTAARWIVRARESLFGHLRGSLERRLKLGAGELESLMAVARSHLDFSLVSLFRAVS